MPDKREREDAAALARLTEAWLGLGAALDVASLGMAALAFAGLLFAKYTLVVRVGLACVIALGALQKYYALRVALDQRLFSQWAARWQNADADPEQDMERLDGVLQSVGKIRDNREPSARSLADRQRGALRLFRTQVFLFLLQGVFLLATALAAGCD